jgi:methylthioribose-1-phosphate isomerase
VIDDGKDRGFLPTGARGRPAKARSVPFVVVAPTSTVDLDARSGSDIPIERREPVEVTTIAGQPAVPLGSPVYNPAFDVTPGDLVTAIVTERGVIAQVNEGSLAALGDRLPKRDDEGS